MNNRGDEPRDVFQYNEKENFSTHVSAYKTMPLVFPTTIPLSIIKLPESPITAKRMRRRRRKWDEEEKMK